MSKILVVADLIAAGFLVAAWWTVWRNRGRLPPTIPIHFGFSGAPDGWATRGMIWLMPVIALALFVAQSVISFVRMPVVPREMMFLIWTEVIGMMYHATRGQIRVALGQETRLGPGIWLWLIAILATVRIFTSGLHR